MREDVVSEWGQMARAGIFTQKRGIHDLKATQASEGNSRLPLDSRSSWCDSVSPALRKDSEIARRYWVGQKVHLSFL